MIWLRLPSRLPTVCPMTTENPAHSGADKLVPPMQHDISALPPTSSAQNTPGKFGLAISAMSGTSRTPSLGTPDPFWYAGLVKTWLAPPPVAPLPSFQTCSVAYP